MICSKRCVELVAMRANKWDSDCAQARKIDAPDPSTVMLSHRLLLHPENAVEKMK